MLGTNVAFFLLNVGNKNNYACSKTFFLINQGKEATLVPGTVEPLHQRNEEMRKPMGIERVAGLAWNWFLVRVDKSTEKDEPGKDKFIS